MIARQHGLVHQMHGGDSANGMLQAETWPADLGRSEAKPSARQHGFMRQMAERSSAGGVP